MDKHKKEQRDRLIALAFVSILLVLIYGPLAPWFAAVDHMIYDRFASLIKSDPPKDTVIVSINAEKRNSDALLDKYGQLVTLAKSSGAKRIILASPPEMAPNAELPGWAAAMSMGAPVFVPSNHRLADVASKTGILRLKPDADGVIRQMILWHLRGGVMAPSLPLAIALDDPAFAADPRVSAADIDGTRPRLGSATQMVHAGQFMRVLRSNGVLIR